MHLICWRSLLQAWIFKALNDDDPAFYYGLAALYGLPWVFHDLQLDGFTGLILILGAIHVQVCRHRTPGDGAAVPPVFYSDCHANATAHSWIVPTT